MAYSKIQKTGSWSAAADTINTNFDNTSTELSKVKQATSKSKGLYATLDELKKAVPSPQVGDWAVVGTTIPGPIYKCATKGVWTATGQTGGGQPIELNAYVTGRIVTNPKATY